MVERARQLRKNATLPERILWARLRMLKQQGLHFRRQAQFGPYIVDFVCHSAKIVVEIDGSQHGEPKGLRHDAARTAFLNAQGYRVLRYWNADILRNSVAVAEAIFAEVESTRSQLRQSLTSVAAAPPPTRLAGN